MPQAFNFKRVTSTGVTTISVSQFGMLHAIALNQQSTNAATASICTIYDSTTTTAGAIQIGQFQANNAGVSDYLYDALYANGLTLNVPNIGPVDITLTFT